MPTTKDMADFIETANGKAFNPDGAYGLQCKDLIDAYCLYLWKNWVDTIRPGNANQCWRGHNPTYFTAIANIAGDLTNFPKYGDVVIWNGDGINPYGHIAIVLWADAYKMKVLQQNVGGTANRPAEIGWLNYDQPGTGPVIGWLRPKVTDPLRPLAPNERWTGPADVNRRKTPTAPDDSNIIDKLPALSRQVWEGYVRGQNIGGEDRWYKDDVGYAHFSGFTPIMADGLPDLTPKAPAKTPLQPNERYAGAGGVNQRNLPRVTDTTIVRQIPGGAREKFDGWVEGEWYTAEDGTKSNKWLKDSHGYALAIFFDPPTVDGLPNLTPPPIVVDPPKDAVETKPEPQPEPVPQPGDPLTRNYIDVSNYQKNIDWAAMKRAGVEGVIIRASEGGDGKPDELLASHVAGARGQGMAVEFYHYSHIGHQDGNTPEWEAECFLKVVAPHFKTGDVVNLDWECPKGCPLDRGDLAVKWMEIVAAKLKCKVRFYSYANLLKTYAGSWAIIRERRFHLWYAAYPSSAAGKGFQTMVRPDVPGWTVDVWQYSGTGRLPGYGSDLDLNKVYLTEEPVPARGEDFESMVADLRAALSKIREHGEEVVKLSGQ